MPAYYLVRAMDQSEGQYARFFEQERVAVGWSAVDFTEGETEDVVRRVVAHYYEGTGSDPRYVGIRKNEVRRFLHMATGDRVVVPVARGVRLAEVVGGVVYDVEAAATDLDLSNQRPVRFRRAEDGSMLTVPRSDLSEGLRRRLRVRGAAVRDLGEFAGELDGIFQARRPADHVAAEEGRLEEAFKSELLHAIRHGRTMLATGGQGLERLVAELLEADGYAAKVLSKRAFPGFGDADVEATRVDHVTETRLLVQVKHHQGETGTWGAEQLAEIDRQRGDEWADYGLVLVTTADVGPALDERARQLGITLLDGDALASWIADVHLSLSPATKHALGLSALPARYDPVPG